MIDLISRDFFGEIRDLLFIEIMYYWREYSPRRNRFFDPDRPYQSRELIGKVKAEESEIKESMHSFLENLRIQRKRDLSGNIIFEFSIKEAGWLKNERSGGSIWIEEDYSNAVNFDWRFITMLNIPENATQDVVLRSLAKLFWKAKNQSIVGWSPLKIPFRRERNLFRSANMQTMSKKIST